MPFLVALHYFKGSQEKTEYFLWDCLFDIEPTRHQHFWSTKFVNNIDATIYSDRFTQVAIKIISRLLRFYINREHVIEELIFKVKSVTDFKPAPPSESRQLDYHEYSCNF